MTAALMRACHPLPSAAVTVFAVLLAVRAGDSPGVCVLLGVAVLTGQLSIGWSNDRIDYRRDRHVERSDKPLAQGELSVRQVDTAIATAVALTVVTSLALGWRAGLVHLGAVGCGWAYNAGLKSTWLSWLPYMLAFGSLPAVATLARADHAGAAWWALAAGALLGLAGHLTNALPDLVDDRRTGVSGLPHRLGARRSLLLAGAGLLGASVILALGPAGAPTALGWAGLAVATGATAVGGAAAWRNPVDRRTFVGTIALVAVDLVLLLLGPSFVR